MKKVLDRVCKHVTILHTYIHTYIQVCLSKGGNGYLNNSLLLISERRLIVRGGLVV